MGRVLPASLLVSSGGRHSFRIEHLQLAEDSIRKKRRNKKKKKKKSQEKKKISFQTRGAVSTAGERITMIAVVPETDAVASSSR